MVEKFDVPSRLEEGRPAVENLQQYVWACHLLGYQHPDLTVHATQLRDWYGTEDGMDLGALHSDCLGFEAAVRSTQDALGVQDRQLSTLSAGWQGAGADACRDFLRRHGEASVAVAAAVRTAAEALAALRDDLWHAIDVKVGAVVAVEGRTQAYRADWLGAAETVTTGAGDRAAAAELVDHAVKPFVDNSISTECLTAMHTAMSSIVDAYQRATTEIAGEHAPVFDVPGDLGPTWSPPPAPASEATGMDAAPAPAPQAVTAPAAWSAPTTAPAAPPAWSAGPAAPPETSAAQAVPPMPPVSPVPTMPTTPSLGSMGSGMPDLGSGLSGLGQQFADTLGGLLGGSGGAVPDPTGLDVPELDDPLDDNGDTGDTGDTEDTDSEDDEVVEDPPVEDPVVAGEPVDPEPEACDGATEVAVDPAPAATPAPPPSEALPPAEPLADPVSDEQTPCAIAADELPQVGDPPE